MKKWTLEYIAGSVDKLELVEPSEEILKELQKNIDEISEPAGINFFDLMEK